MLATLAHMGGIDEIGMFVVPAVAIILFLRRAERRARERAEAQAASQETHAED